MSTCNVRQNSIDALVKKGVIDSSMTIVDGGLFNELNQTYSDIAKTKYGVKNEGLLFTKEVKEVPRLGASVYNREDTTNVLKAVPNDEMFNELQNNYDNQPGLAYQLEEVPASKANKATLDIIKTAAAKMGISIEELDQYAKDAKLDIEPNVVGLSHIQRIGNVVKAVIAIAQGKEDQALTEEYVHIASAMVEQTTPQVITSMIAKIDRFKIYKQVFEKYKNNPNYLSIIIFTTINSWTITIKYYLVSINYNTSFVFFYSS